MKNAKASGFTLIEVLIVIAIIATLAGLVLSNYASARQKAYYGRALNEFKVMHTALEQYYIEHEEYPADVTRDTPPGIEQYLSGSDANKAWPNAPWPGSVYDWDVYDNNGTETYQISIRFCEYGKPETCHFPKTDWAKDFEVNSSLYFCISGKCKPHPLEPDNYPGYCANCEGKN